MKAIAATRRQDLIFLVPDHIAEQMEKNELTYDSLVEELDKIASEHHGGEWEDFLVYAATGDADVDRVMPIDEAAQHVDLARYTTIIERIRQADAEQKECCQTCAYENQPNTHPNCARCIDTGDGWERR